MRIRGALRAVSLKSLPSPADTLKEPGLFPGLERYYGETVLILFYRFQQ
jgi:hypothetical protein